MKKIAKVINLGESVLKGVVGFGVGIAIAAVMGEAEDKVMLITKKQISSKADGIRKALKIIR